MVDDSINIRGLKRVAADFAGEWIRRNVLRLQVRRLRYLAEETRRTQCGILFAADGTSRLQYGLPELGGMLRYGMQTARLPKDRLDEDIKAILKTGVKIKHGLKIGESISINDLRNAYDAVHL